MTRRVELILLATGITAFVAACLLVHPIGVTIADETPLNGVRVLWLSPR